VTRRVGRTGGLGLLLLLVVAAVIAIAWLGGSGTVLDCETEPRVQDGAVYEIPSCG